MNHRDGTPEIREPAVWVLMRLRGTTLRSLSTHKPSARGNYWLAGGARVLELLVIPCPIRKFMIRAYIKV